jgi:hypothetical protein
MKGSGYQGTLGRNMVYTLTLCILSTLGSCDRGPFITIPEKSESNGVGRESEYVYDMDLNQIAASHAYCTVEPVSLSKDSLHMLRTKYVDIGNDGALDMGVVSHFNVGRDGWENQIGQDTSYILTRDGKKLAEGCGCSEVVKVRPDSGKGSSLVEGFGTAKNRYEGIEEETKILL